VNEITAITPQLKDKRGAIFLSTGGFIAD